jgi:hypothetical protein
MTDLGQPSQLESSPTPELLQRTLAELRELLQIEISLAKNEAAAEFESAKAAALSGVVAFGLGLSAMNLLLFALFMALGILPSVIVGLVMAAAAVWLAIHARARFPKSILSDTRKRLSEDVDRLREHAA